MRPIWTTNGSWRETQRFRLLPSEVPSSNTSTVQQSLPTTARTCGLITSGFDIDRDPPNAVRIAIQAYDPVKRLLEEDHLQLSERKTCCVVSNNEAKRMLKEQLPAGGPQVHDVMRDLGVDCTAGRLRRIMTMKGKESKQLWLDR